MTLIVAIRCTNGVVIAADSAASDEEVGTKQRVIKIRRVGTCALLYGGSGDGGLLQRIDEELQLIPARDSFKRMRPEIRKALLPITQEAIKTHVAYPQQPFHLPPVAVLLFAGVSEGQPWILEVERDGRDTRYGDDLGNFAAIGSGKPWAQAVMRPHLSRPKDLEAGKIFAYRAVDDAIELAAGGLSKPIVMFTLGVDGTISEVTSDELEALGQTTETWRELEREAVGRLLAGDTEPEGKGAEIPQPKE